MAYKGKQKCSISRYLGQKSMIEVKKITPAIGAEISGVNFSKPIKNKVLDSIYRALIENLVIFFRGTNISPRTHIDFSKNFGVLDEPHQVYPSRKGYPRIVKLENDKNSPPDTDAWHTDLTFKRKQPFASVLVARSVPNIGGDTLWSSSYAAYKRLPEGMKFDFEKLKCIHDMGDFRNSFTKSQEGNSRVDDLNKGMSTLGQNIRNLIEKHPVTGKKYLNFNESFVAHIIGLTMNDSNALKAFLTNHMNKPEDQVRWSWKSGDIAMWDNRVTMHYAVADYLPSYRWMDRVTIIKDKRV